MWSTKQLSITELGEPGGEAVVVLGGLGPNLNFMGRLKRHFADAGYRVIDVDYPSTHHGIETLANEQLAPALEHVAFDPAQPVHFVTLSMGGIIARAYLKKHRPPNLGRVVMLAPPNHGSEVADFFQSWPLFRNRFGPAGLELTTDADSTPNQLGPADYEVGVIAGDYSALDPWFAWMFSGPNDGKVSVESAKLEGMTDFVVVRASHYLIMKDATALQLAERFLRTGQFNPNASHVVRL